MSEITIENICAACERAEKPCLTPCELWYKCLEGEEITLEELSCNTSQRS